MGAPEGVDPAVHVRLSELQEAIENVAQQIPEVPEYEAPDPYDDRELKREVADLATAIRLLQQQINDLKREFPVHMFAKVTGEQNDYIECVWYNIRLDRTGQPINIAKPPALRGSTGHYAVGDVVTVVRCFTGVTDGASHLLVYMDNSGGGSGGGFQIYVRASYAALSPVVPDDIPSFGFTTDIHQLYLYDKADPSGGYAWHAIPTFNYNAVPSGQGEIEGDTMYVDGVFYVRADSGDWEPCNRLVDVI